MRHSKAVQLYTRLCPIWFTPIFLIATLWVMTSIAAAQDHQLLEAAPQADAQENTTPANANANANAALGDEGNASQANASTDPAVLLKALWQDAVVTGQTDLGYTAWLVKTLNITGGQDAPSKSPAPTPVSGLTPQGDRTLAVSGRWAKRTTPVSLGRAGRVITTFGQAIPNLVCAPDTVCVIELERGERLADSPSLGNAANWQVSVKRHGADERVLLELRPSEDANRTNLVVHTNKRLYTITLELSETHYTPILAFRYPQSEANAIKADIAARKTKKRNDAAATAATARKKRKKAVNETGTPTSNGLVPARDLDFGFVVRGKAKFRPVRVYSNGKETFIQLHPSYRGDLPSVLPGAKEVNKSLNVRVARGGKMLIADRVIRDVTLRLGKASVSIMKGR